MGWKLLVLKFFESKNIRTLDNAWGSGFLNFWKFEPYFVLISYLNFYQFKGMFLFFFLISGVLGYIFLIFQIFNKNLLLRAWKLTMYNTCIHTLKKFDLFCKILFFWYTFDPKVPTYRTFQGIPYLNLGSEVSYFLFF